MTNISSNTYHLFFSNLSNPLRIEIISALKDADKGMSVGEIAQRVRSEQSKLSHALANLRECNLVSVKQKGKTRIYSLNKKTMLPILKMIDKHARSFCNGKCKSFLHH